jgi:micrococcal nuclease
MKKSILTRSKLFFICLGLFSAFSVSWYSIQEKRKFVTKVVRIVDGDTFSAMRGQKEVKIRLYGIDCPELGQSYGKMAKIYAESFLEGQEVEIEVRAVDKYGRLVCIVKVGSVILNEQLLKEGLAWHYTFFDHSTYFKKWSAIQDSCMIYHVGIWSESNPVSPSVFRKNK